jgi:hypothetical protein
MRNDPLDVIVTTSDGDIYKAFTWIYGAKGAIVRARLDAKRFGITLTSVTVYKKGTGDVVMYADALSSWKGEAA